MLRGDLPVDGFREAGRDEPRPPRRSRAIVDRISTEISVARVA
jgi:hypothetical protein